MRHIYQGVSVAASQKTIAFHWDWNCLWKSRRSMHPFSLLEAWRDVLAKCDFIACLFNDFNDLRFIPWLKKNYQSLELESRLSFVGGRSRINQRQTCAVLTRASGNESHYLIYFYYYICLPPLPRGSWVIKKHLLPLTYTWIVFIGKFHSWLVR